MSLIEVRPATLSDIPAIVRVEAGENGPWGEPDSCFRWTARRLARGFFIRIAFLDGEPAGHAEWIESGEPHGRTFYLGALQVRKDLQRAGVGRAMLADGEAEALRRGCGALSTMPDLTTGSDAFYAKCGFVKARRAALIEADARDVGVALSEISAIPESDARETRFVAGLYQFSARHMYEVAFHPPEGHGRIVRCAEVPGGRVALMRFPEQTCADALAWGRFSAPEALAACLTFAARIGVPQVEFLFDAAEAGAVRALGLGEWKDAPDFEVIKRLGLPGERICV